VVQAAKVIRYFYVYEAVALAIVLVVAGILAVTGILTAMNPQVPVRPAARWRRAGRDVRLVSLPVHDPRRCQRRPSRVRDLLNFEAAFRAVESGDCTPLLGRYDRIIEYDRQHSSYTGMPLSVLNRGHVTGALASATLRQHVFGPIQEPN
jgi:hypothetical protein